MMVIKSGKNILAKVTVALALFTVSFSSCVYFNTLYNARRAFDDAEKKLEQGTSGRALEDEYQKVVVKCSKILQNNPDSKWADDAAFLLGKALFRQEEYGKSEKKFKEIIENWPDEQYAPLSHYWLSKIYFETKEYNRALEQAEYFLDKYPKHEERFKVMLMAGRIDLAMERREEALGYFSRVIDESEKEELVEEAMLEAAGLHYSFEQWEEAAGYYESILKKGITWDRRYNVSLPLARCYTELGRCRDALAIYSGLLEEVTERIEKPPVLIGTAGAYVCMDSLDTAIEYYEEVLGKFPQSLFSAEASYRLGSLYHEKVDSLQKAKDYFSRVGKEAAESEYATEALKKANSISRLIEFESMKDGESTHKQKAEKLFYSAEIQLEQFEQTEKALKNYKALLDSFPGTEVAPRAAYAVGWIYQKKLDRKESALEAYSRLAADYPRSAQAAGALEQLGGMGADRLRDSLSAYVDSINALPPDTAEVKAALELTDTTAVEAAPERADSTAAEPSAAPADSAKAVQPFPARPDTSEAGTVTAPPDTAAAEPPSAPVPSDSSATGQDEKEK